MARVAEFPRALSSLSGLFDLLGREFERHGVDDGSAFWVSLAVEEVFTNMIRHNESSGKQISVELDISERRVSARLTDYGVAKFDPETVPTVDTTLSTEERTPGGLGVFFVRAKMDEIAYSHQDGNLSVSFAKEREVRVG